MSYISVMRHNTLVSALVVIGIVSTGSVALGSDSRILRVIIRGDAAFLSRDDGVVESIDLAASKCNWSQVFHKRCVDALQVSPGDSALGVSASEDPSDVQSHDEVSSVVVWRVSDGKVVRSTTANLAVASVVLSPDGATVLAGGYAGEQGVLFRIVQQEAPQPIPGFETSMVSRVAPVDRKTVLVGTEDHEIAIVSWDQLEAKANPIRTNVSIGRIEALCPLADNRIAVGTERGCLAVVDLKTGDILSKRDFPGGLGIREIRVRDSTLIACSDDRLITARISEGKLEDFQQQTSKLGQIGGFDLTSRGDAVIIGHWSGVLSRLRIDCEKNKLASPDDEKKIKIVRDLSSK